MRLSEPARPFAMEVNLALGVRLCCVDPVIPLRAVFTKADCTWVTPVVPAVGWAIQHGTTVDVELTCVRSEVLYILD